MAAHHFAHHAAHHVPQHTHHHGPEHEHHSGFIHTDFSERSDHKDQSIFKRTSSSSLAHDISDEHKFNSLVPDGDCDCPIDRVSKEEEAEPAEDRKHPILDSHLFVGFVSVIVLVNACTMGLEVDHPEWEWTWFICEQIFTVVFAVEMVVKIVCLGRHYFWNGFNILDFCLAWLSILDLWLIPLVAGSTNAVDLQSLSIFRMLRMARLVRVVKLVKHAPQMVLVISGVVQAMQTTCWIGLVLWVFVYIFGIFFTRLFGQDSADLYPGFSMQMEEIDEQEVMANYNPYLSFGTLDRSIITLFNIAILSEWTEIVRPIYVKQPYYVPFFLIFVMFVTFGVMNVFIGMIVDRVTTNARKIEEDKERQGKQNKVNRIDDMKRILFNGDEKKSLTPEELTTRVKADDTLKALLEEVELPHDFTARDLAHMLDTNGDGKVDARELVNNFKRLVLTDDFEFHSLCMTQAGLNGVKHDIYLLKKTMRNDLEMYLGNLHEEMNRRFNALEASLQNCGSGPGPGGDACFTATSPEAEEEPLGEPACGGIASQREVGGGASNKSLAAAAKPQLVSRRPFQALTSTNEPASEEKHFSGAVRPPESDQVFPDAAGVSSVADKASISPTSEDALQISNDRAQIIGASLQRSGSGLSGSSQRPLLARRAEAQEHDDGSANIPSGTRLGSSPSTSGKDENEGVIFDHMGNTIVEELVRFEGRTPLGFEVRWSWPPTVGVVHEGSQAAKKGLQSGDVLIECNEVQMAGKTRADLLDLLVVRPMTLKIRRDPQRAEVGNGGANGIHVDNQMGSIGFHDVR